MAVWAILQQLWPHQFRRDVDEADPAGVWEANVGGFDDDDLVVGLRALRQETSKHMPNAPNCAELMRKAINEHHRQAEPPPPSEPSCMVKRSASILWISYTFRLGYERKQTITTAMARECHRLSRPIVRDYRSVWDSEPDKSSETWGALMEDMAHQLLVKWNAACRVGLKIETLDELQRSRAT